MNVYDDQFDEARYDEDRAAIDGAGQLLTCGAAVLLVTVLLCSLATLVVIYG